MSVQAEAKHALIKHLCLFNCQKMSIHTYHQLLRQTKVQLHHYIQSGTTNHQHQVAKQELAILHQPIIE